MKKFLLPTILIFFGISAIAQIENGDFESWNKINLFEHPATGIEAMSSNYETHFDNGETNVNEIAHNGGSAVRIENIQGTEEVMPGYFLFGNTPDSDGEAMIFGDGFEVTDASVTGVQMDLRYDFPNESSGFVIVQFKADGMPVGEGNMGPGTFMFPLSGSQDWASTEFSFEAPIEVAIDQCVIGIASADLIMEDSPFELGAFVEVDNVELLNSSDEVPGGDFDSWSFVDPIYTPEAINVDVRPFEANFKRSLDSFDGNYALALLTTDHSGETNIGEAIMGIVENDEITPTIQLQEESSVLSFMYRYSTQNDMAEARFIFYQENGDSFEPVFSESLDLMMTQDYELVEYDFGTTLNDNNIEASHMAIVFSSSKMDENEPQSGSVLLLDNVQFGTPLSIFQRFNNRSNISITAFPNPTANRVVFRFNNTKSGFYRVFNGMGVQIDIVEYSNAGRVLYDLTSYPSGKYFFTFNHSNGHSESVRVIKY